MRIALAQVNPVVGDVSGNLARLTDLLARVSGDADLVVFPELFLVGYPPRDLLERHAILEGVEQALRRIQEISRDLAHLGIIVGAPRPTGQARGKGLYNSALLIHRGEVVGCRDKSLLPTYDVFDETRYFESSRDLQLIPFQGRRLGITICEDAWCQEETWCRRLYAFDPVGNLAGQGADLLINLSASPFQVGKEETRYRLMGQHARKYGLPFIYVNQVGGNDELIFDGRSLAFDRRGEPLAVLPAFQEACLTVDLARAGTPGLYVPPEPAAAVCGALELGLKDYLRKCGFRQAVVGLSGGVDSAVVAALAARALGPENVLGVAMPSMYSSPDSLADARELAANLGIDFKVVPITPIYQAYKASLGEHFPVEPIDITLENIQARIRGNILMAFSNRFGHLVLSTGNKSELAVGYCTLYGDMSGGLAVLADVPKTMVYELARVLNRERRLIPEAILTKPPSAELRPDQKDQDTLPPYEILDQIIHHYLVESRSAREIIDLGFEAETVRWVIKSIDHNEYKRRQAAPGLRVTSKAFGMGRRIPIAARYEG